MQSIIEAKIRARLDRTERWARQVFDGPANELEAFVTMARDQTLNAIGAAVRPYMQSHMNQHPVMVSNLN